MQQLYIWICLNSLICPKAFCLTKKHVHICFLYFLHRDVVRKTLFLIRFRLRFCLPPPFPLGKNNTNLWITQLWVNFVGWSNSCSHTFSDKQERKAHEAKKENRTAPSSSYWLPQELFNQTAPLLPFSCQSGKITAICPLVPEC